MNYIDKSGIQLPKNYYNPSETKNSKEPNETKKSENLNETKKTEYNKLNPLFSDEDEDEDLEDDDWVDKKKDFWKKNNIFPININCKSITPEEHQKLFKDKYFTK